MKKFLLSLVVVLSFASSAVAFELSENYEVLDAAYQVISISINNDIEFDLKAGSSYEDKILLANEICENNALYDIQYVWYCGVVSGFIFDTNLEGTSNVDKAIAYSTFVPSF